MSAIDVLRELVEWEPGRVTSALEALRRVETVIEAAREVLAWKGPKYRSEYHDRLDALAAALRDMDKEAQA